MNEDKLELPWINYEVAIARVQAMQDRLEAQFVMRAVTIVVNKFAHDDLPVGILDMLYFVEIMSALYKNKEGLLRLLSGEDLGWYSDYAE